MIHQAKILCQLKIGFFGSSHPASSWRAGVGWGRVRLSFDWHPEILKSETGLAKHGKSFSFVYILIDAIVMAAKMIQQQRAGEMQRFLNIGFFSLAFRLAIRANLVSKDDPTVLVVFEVADAFTNAEIRRCRKRAYVIVVHSPRDPVSFPNVERHLDFSTHPVENVDEALATLRSESFGRRKISHYEVFEHAAILVLAEGKSMSARNAKT